MATKKIKKTLTPARKATTASDTDQRMSGERASAKEMNEAMKRKQQEEQARLNDRMSGERASAKKMNSTNTKKRAAKGITAKSGKVSTSSTGKATRKNIW